MSILKALITGLRTRGLITHKTKPQRARNIFTGGRATVNLQFKPDDDPFNRGHKTQHNVSAVAGENNTAALRRRGALVPADSRDKPRTKGTTNDPTLLQLYSDSTSAHRRRVQRVCTPPPPRWGGERSCIGRIPRAPADAPPPPARRQFLLRFYLRSFYYFLKSVCSLCPDSKQAECFPVELGSMRLISRLRGVVLVDSNDLRRLALDSVTCKSGPPQPGQPIKFTVGESCDRIKEEFNFLQAQYHNLKLECEKLASEKIEIQRHYVMYYEMSYGLNVEMHKQARASRPRAMFDSAPPAVAEIFKNRRGWLLLL
ncbi:Transducin-like enhancer protein 4 [Eumeta japonica]|uniref:Transducin-like enhancer protein 4 n=1 Tax=Eumeta variegata TaxID=151549 RepID=A0A4C1ZZ17_EUMVA|nr:Transducin-like enhancer protein 4 [Eumeta japonica]